MADAPRPGRDPAAALEPTAAERRALDAAARGEPAAFEPESPEVDRTLRAELLTALLLGLRDDWPVDPRGLRVAGAVVTGRFDLSYARSQQTGGPATPSFVFTGCTFDEPINLTSSHLDHVAFEGCTLRALIAPSLRCARISLRRSHIADAVDLAGTKVDGPVNAGFAQGVTHFDLGESRVGGDFLLAADGREGEVEVPRTLRLVDADIRGGVYASGRSFDRIDAERAKVGAAVELNNTIIKSFGIPGARIAGQLAMAGAKLRNPRGTALNANLAEILGNAVLQTTRPDATFESEGEIRLLGARIGGQLRMDGAKLSNAGGVALGADGAEIVNGAFLQTRHPGATFEAEGEIRLHNARIGGQLGMNGAKLRNANGAALNGEMAQIRGGVFLRDDPGVTFSALGLVRFPFAHLEGLDVAGAELSRSENQAVRGATSLQLQFSKIDGPLFLRARGSRPLACRGRVDLSGAQVDGEVDLRGSVFIAEDRQGENEDRKALCFDRAELRSTVRFGRRGGFTSVVVGAASFDGARLAKDLVLTDGVFRVDAGDDPLAAGARARPSDDAVTRRKLGVCLSLRGMRVEGLLHSQRFGPRSALTTAAKRLRGGDGVDEGVAPLRDAETAVSAEDCAEDGDGALHPNGLFDLTGASIGTIDDHPLHGWPKRDGLLDLDGCTYTGLELLEPPPARGWRSWLRRAVPGRHRRPTVRGDETARIWQRRLAWLDLQWPGTRPGREHFRPQPFEQLAKVLRAMGHDADRIAVEKRRFALRCRADRGVAFFLNGILSWTSDFGYAPGRVLFMVLVALLLGFDAIWWGVDRGWLALTAGGAAVSSDHFAMLAVYVIDAFLPFLTLAGTPVLDRGSTTGTFQAFLLAYNLAGVVLTSILVVTLTGLLRKD